MQGTKRAGTVLALVITAWGLAAALPARAIMLVTRADEVRIGKQVEAESIKQYGLSNDAPLAERVRKVGAAVAAASPRKDVTYTYKVLHSNEINAFSAPGGPVMITDRLARMLSTDDELAFVLGHETGHIAAEHGRKAINQALIAQGIASILFRNAGQLESAGVNIMYTLYDRGYSRDQEYQADSYGVQLITKAGYKPEGAVTALAKLGLDQTKGVNKYFATHPDTPDRIHRVAQMGGVSKQREQELIQQVKSRSAPK